MQREIQIDVPAVGSIKTDLKFQLNNFAVMEIRNLLTHDVISDTNYIVIHRHIREIEPRDKLTFIIFRIMEDGEKINAAEVVFQLDSGDYEVKPKRPELVKDLAISVEYH